MVIKLFATLSLLAFAGAASAQAGCPVKVGGILPLTGSMAPITKKISQAAELAFEHINAALVAMLLWRPRGIIGEEAVVSRHAGD